MIDAVLIGIGALAGIVFTVSVQTALGAWLISRIFKDLRR